MRSSRSEQGSLPERLLVGIVTVILAVCSAALAANATTQDYTDPTAFAAATTNLTTVGFGGILPAGVPYLDFNPLMISGVSFSTPTPGAFVNVTAADYYSPNNYPAPFIVDSISPNASNTLVISFSLPTHAFGLQYGGLGVGVATFTLSNGHVYTPPTLPSLGQTTFVGFVSTDEISSVTFFVANGYWVVQSLVLASPTVSGLPILATPIVSGLGAISSASTASPTSSQDNLGTQATTAEPISTGNGNYFCTHTDFATPGRGMPIAFQRSYNTLDNYAGPLGANWTHSYNIALFQDVSSNIIVKWGDGHGETFTLSGSTYVPQPGVFNLLVKNADGTFLLVRKDQTQFAFSASGRLTSIVDKNGNTILLTYDGSGNLVRITDTVGRNLNFSYDASNRITQITDAINRTVSFQYDDSDNLVKATDEAGGISTYAYDANHRVTSITQPNGATLLTNTYDSSGRVVSQAGGRGFTWTFAYDTPAPNETTITDARGGKTIHAYDSSLRIMQITDAAGGTTSFTYDANNDRTSVTNQDGKTTNFVYDSLGNITGITDPLGDTSSFTYDTRNDLLAATNANGHTTNFTYDGNGNLTGIKDALGDATTFAYDGHGELTSKTDARGDATTYVYDGSGNLTTITDALGHSTNLAYDGIGRLTSITDPNGHTAAALYDALSRLVKISDPLGDQTKFAYDPVGNLLRITDANGNATNYAYDGTNDLVSVTDALGHVTKYGYDAANNRATFTNAKGNTTSYAYDALNRLVTITDPLSFVTSYAYDAVGNVVSTTDAKSQTNQFTYDALNRLLGIAYADGKAVTYAYDANGNRTSMVDSHGTTAYSYDALDRLVSVTNPGGKVVSYSFDPVGNRHSVTYPDGKTVTYAYDRANKLSGITDWLGRKTAYAYDPASNLIGTAYPNNAALAFNYDQANRLVKVSNSYRGSANLPLNPVTSFSYVLDAVGNRLQITDGSGKATSYGYDPLYELTSVTSGTNVTTFSYDPAGNRLSLTAPGTSIAYTYDAADRMLTAGTTAFTYDANGNQISKIEAGGGTTVYSYDAANRLNTVFGPAAMGVFAYDGDGNRLKQTVGTGTYNYVNDVATALPVVLQESGPDGNVSYAYGLGLISESSSAFNYFYHYDGLGSVVGLTDSNGKLAGRYVYDAWGNADLTVPAPQLGTDNKFRFTGEALDPGTGLYYLRARYYDPTAGRFIGRDAFSGFIHSHSISLNRYVYAANSPTNNFDPSGLWSIGDLLNKASDAVVAATSGLSLSATTVAKGYVDTVAFVGGDAIVPIPGLHQLQAFLGNAQVAEAKVLNSSVAAFEGVNLTPAEQQAFANQVVEVTNIASFAVGLPNAITDISKIGFANLNLFKVSTALTTIKQLYNISDLVNDTIGLGNYIVSGLSGSSTPATPSIGK